ncbi:MAG: PAQR family membrane homeostasis protein TrhA [Chlamydiota bacterium]
MVPTESICPISKQNPREEIFNSISHGVGIIFSIVGLVLAVTYAALYGTTWHVVSCSIYGTTMLLLYSASTIYHSCRSPKVKNILQVIDYSCIALFIAGTYTPFTLLALRGPWGWSLFSTVWTLALVVLGLSIFYAGKSYLLFSIIYLAMGWLIVLAIVPLLQSMALGGNILLISGGLAYSVGVIFYLLDNMPFNHPIWHLFVLAGSVCHYFAVLFYLIPR